jgi:hypothetical protein
MSDETKEPEIVEAELVEAETAMAIDSLTRAEIDIQIATAHRFPRNIALVKREITDMATIDAETAEACYYSLKRGGKPIQGPSIRMAEIAQGSFGNLRVATRFLGETEDGKFIRVLGICHDLQKNVAVAQEVTRRITGRDGQRYNEDMIGTTIAAASSIALRNAIFRVVPRALINSAFEKCKKIVAGDVQSLGERRRIVIDRLLKAYTDLTLERILARCEVKSIEEITTEHVVDLVGVGTAIKEGTTKVETEFPEPPTKVEVAAPVTVAEPKKEKAKGDKAIDPEAPLDPVLISALKELIEGRDTTPKGVENWLMEKFGILEIEEMKGKHLPDFKTWLGSLKPRP